MSTTQRTINEEIISLPWNYELKQYSLEQSHSRFNLAKGYSLLLGEAARRYDRIAQGTAEDPSTEALVFNHNTGVRLVFSYHPVGYVSLDDWEDLEADDLMQEIFANADRINTERARHNRPTLRIGGWLQKPRLNPDNHSVSWVFDVIDGEESKVNAVSIKLGRKGYEKITWVSSYDNYLKSMDALPFLVDQHAFKEGYRYSDYTIGEHMAALGVASLVAVTAGGKPYKSGWSALLAALTALGKKLMVPALIALGALEVYCRKLFRRKSEALPDDPLYI